LAKAQTHSKKHAAAPSSKARLPGPADPSVLLDVDYSKGRLFFALVNAGPAPAYDIIVKFRGSLRGVGGEVDISRLRIFRRLSLLRPRNRIRIFIDAAHLLFARRQSTVVSVLVTYRDREHNRFAESFSHDLAIYRDFVELLKPS